ncbi:hypothetical protein GALMADRAFT_136181 [Galerina marginata CBS 339.88]|uniref:Uncharacterized protein n=1 Tax=Galerina marginata (strain CBS 339.88) TaxID=685588 RepID=A0A067TMI8_GALM3|nr:hypothetical protein GALMADRAFT_136181 [Galerina marginata CBS 339.88]
MLNFATLLNQFFSLFIRDRSIDDSPSPPPTPCNDSLWDTSPSSLEPWSGPSTNPELGPLRIYWNPFDPYCARGPLVKPFFETATHILRPVVDPIFPIPPRLPFSLVIPDDNRAADYVQGVLDGMDDPDDDPRLKTGWRGPYWQKQVHFSNEPPEIIPSLDYTIEDDTTAVNNDSVINSDDESTLVGDTSSIETSSTCTFTSS